MIVPWLCDEFGSPLDEHQRAVAVCDDANILINAGPGSGKTRVLVAHYLHLLITHCDWEVDSVTAITFTEKAAAEFKDRAVRVLQRVLQQAPQEQWQKRATEILDRIPEAPVGTIHSFCARLLRHFALLADLDPSFRILDELETNSLRRKVSERWLWKQLIDKSTKMHESAKLIVTYWGFERAEELLENLLAHRLLIEYQKMQGKQILCCVSKLTDAEKALEQCCYECIVDYDTAKAQLNVLDFDDLLLKVWKLFRENKSALEETRRRYRRVLVDELQDTDSVQMAILSLLCGWDEDNGTKDNHKPKFFGVGDSQQSIYSFRNADVSLFNRLWDWAKNKLNWRTDVLGVNYRSVASLVRLTNYTFDRIFTTTETKIFEQPFKTRFQPMEFHRPNESDVALELAFFLLPDRTSKWSRLQWEAEWIAQRISELHNDGVRFQDIALLLRELINLSVYEDALRRYEIPYYIVSGYGFFETMEAFDLLTFLQVLADPDDKIALASWLRSPAVGISDEALFCFFECMKRGVDIIDANFKFDRPEKSIDALLDTLLPEQQKIKLQWAGQFLAQAKAKLDYISVRQLLEWFIKDTRYEAIVSALPHGRQRLANIRKFIRLAQQLAEQMHLNLRGLVRVMKELVESEVRVGEPPLTGSRTDAVQVMTIHSAKGLEFPSVIVPMVGEVSAPQASKEMLVTDFEKGIAVRLYDELGNSMKREQMPNFTAVDELRIYRERAETERLLFVAWTRAKDKLILVGSVDEKTLMQRGDGTWTNWLQLISDTLKIPVGKSFEEPFVVSEKISISLRGETVNDDDLRRMVRKISVTKTIGEEWLKAPDTIPDLAKPSYDLPPKAPSLIRLTVTDLLTKDKWVESEAQVKTLENPSPAELGSLVHQLLSYQIFDPTETQLKWIAQFIGMNEEAVISQAEVICQLVQKALRSPVWKEFQNANERWHELDFLVRLKGDPEVELAGRWDLLCHLPSCWLVVDFKTDSISSPSEAELKFTDHYQLQAKAYAYAVHKVFGAEVVQTVFVFIGLPEPYEVTRMFKANQYEHIASELVDKARRIFVNM